ncbi:MAG TPA: hypothetical protein VF615_23515 [Longimicrobiaceae bacterium]
MPRSSHPLNLLSAWILFSVALPCTIVGVVGALAETGTMRVVLGALGLSGLAMVWGSVQMVVAWRRATRRETAHEAALYQAVRQAAPAVEPPQALQEGAQPAFSAAAAADPAAPAARTSPAAHTTGEADAEVLAHWTYAPDEWSEYSRRELSFRRGEAKWYAAGVVGLGALLLVFQRNAEYTVALGVAGFVGAVFWLGKTLQARAAHAANTATPGGEVIISPRAVMLNGRYHVLQDDRFHFAGVRLLDEEVPPVLEFTVAWQTRSGRADEQVYVPVPRGREEEARALVARLTAGNRE